MTSVVGIDTVAHHTSTEFTLPHVSNSVSSTAEPIQYAEYPFRAHRHCEHHGAGQHIDHMLRSFTKQGCKPRRANA